MKNLLFFLTVIILSCNSAQNEKLQKENELLKKEKELIEKEKELLKKESEEKENPPAAVVIEEPGDYPIVDNVNPAKISSPDIKKIKRDLIGRTVKKSKKESWTFAALSEFKNVQISKSERNGDYFEAELNLDLEDLNNGKEYFMKLFVSYNLAGDTWIIQSLNPILYYPK